MAVFYGILFIAILSKELKLISDKKFNDILEIFNLLEKRIGLLKIIQKKIKINDALDSFLSDKISTDNSFTFLLLTENGFILKNKIDKEKVILSLEKFKEY